MVEYKLKVNIKTKHGKLKSGDSVFIVSRFKETSFIGYKIDGKKYHDWLPNEKVDLMIKHSKKIANVSAIEKAKKKGKKKAAKKKRAKKK